MKLEEFKQFVEYARSQKLTFVKIGDVEFGCNSDSFDEPVTVEETTVEEASPEELIRTVKEKANKEREKFLRELFNHE